MTIKNCCTRMTTIYHTNMKQKRRRRYIVNIIIQEAKNTTTTTILMIIMLLLQWCGSKKTNNCDVRCDGEVPWPIVVVVVVVMHTSSRISKGHNVKCPCDPTVSTNIHHHIDRLRSSRNRNPRRHRSDVNKSHVPWPRNAI